MNTKFDPTKPVQRRDGKGRVEILCADLTMDPYAIAARHIMSDGVCVLAHTAEGHWMTSGESDSDLINIPEPPKWDNDLRMLKPAPKREDWLQPKGTDSPTPLTPLDVIYWTLLIGAIVAILITAYAAIAYTPV